MSGIKTYNNAYKAPVLSDFTSTVVSQKWGAKECV